MTRSSIGVLAACLGLAAIAGCKGEKSQGANSSPASQPATSKPTASQPAATGNVLLHPTSQAFQATPPDTFRVQFTTTKGDFTVMVHTDWAPNGAKRFYNLVRNNFFSGARFFRVISGFVAQFGLTGDPAVDQAWMNQTIPDDPVKHSNTRGTLTFAASGSPNSRSTQMFINYGDNSQLDKMGFAPIGEVVQGMDVVSHLFSGYGEGAPQGKGPSQTQILQQGNSYLEKDFPNLDYIKSATIIGG